MAQKKDPGSKTLRELEKLLIADVHERQSPRFRRRRLLIGIAIRLGVYASLTGLCYALRWPFAGLQTAVAVLIFFVCVEAFGFYQLDRRLLKFFHRNFRKTRK